MKLYHYDHCPFCVRARMIIGLRGLNVEQIPLANDDEATPIGLVGKKMVPILIKDDGTAMGESLDILGARLGYEDIITFPLLRNLTMVKGVNYPPEVRRYVEMMSEKSRVPLFDDTAL